MRKRLEILLAGRAREELKALEALLCSQGDIQVITRLMVNGHVDVLEDISPLPDALVLMVGEYHWEAELMALCERPASQRPPLLVVGPKGNVELIRLAMRAGARDFFSPPIDDSEIIQFLRELARDRQMEPDSVARTTAVINAKGGSGASLVAANLAHRLARQECATVLVDMDVQFGSLPLYFNLVPDHGLVRALESADSLDGLALEAYLQRHDSGLGLLASSPGDHLGVGEVPETRVEQLMQVLSGINDEVVVDLPRWLNGANACVLEHADRVLMVMQQSVAHLHDAQRLRDVLVHELRISPTRISVVVNRYDRKHDVDLGSIGDALPGLSLHTLPNDFKRASHSINMGSPLHDFAPKAPLTRQLKSLVEALEQPSPGHYPARKRSLLGWALPRRH
ncbi:AAA family ATPase [Billgrantia lactosivorans]|uniref:AAA family ATPase n=1 Tax=Billgrantia lactosivorans TaxID=2185141 RepID=UPI000DAD298A|nr:P-loop NTPase [Halomonas lactosivorans]